MFGFTPPGARRCRGRSPRSDPRVFCSNIGAPPQIPIYIKTRRLLTRFGTASLEGRKWVFYGRVFFSGLSQQVLLDSLQLGRRPHLPVFALERKSRANVRQSFAVATGEPADLSQKAIVERQPQFCSGCS